jgi:hypothetical protein
MEGGIEHRAFVADPVDVRRLHVGMAANPQLVEPEIVDQNDQEIGFALLLGHHFPRARRVPERTLMGGLDGHQSVAPLIARTLFEDQQ